jgi:sirohydrochlorin ferrochelatase
VTGAGGRRALVAVAHGSAHPAAAQTVAAIARNVTRLAPVIDVRVAFVQHGEPSLPRALAEAGKNAVIVPLLLSTGYHLTTDIAAVAAGDAGQAWPVAGPLGPDQLLVTALTHRLAEAGVPDGTPVVLAAAGSADPEAARQIAAQAGLLAAALAVPVEVAFAAAGTPSVPAAVADLRARTGAQVAVASYLLTQGHFHDQLRTAGADWVTGPLGDHPAVAALIIDRYRTAA